ncbi:MAG: hypothetical protein Q9213_002298 [Squamulea squamosa]
MDPASFSFAVVGMFLTCCKGYKFLSDTSKAHADSQDAAHRVLVEFYVLRTWGDYFKLHPDLPEQKQPPSLKFNLINDHARNGVFLVLRAISEIFTDVRRLDKKYGIVCDHPRKGESSPRVSRELQDFLAGRADPPKLSGGATVTAHSDTATAMGSLKVKMSLLERCRWSVRDKGRVKDLVERLKECNANLDRLCRFEPLAQMERALPALALPQHSNFIDLLKVADVAEQSAQDKASPTVAGRERLAAMARFKARLMTPPKIASKYQNPWPLLDQRDYVVCSTSHPYSLGESLESQEPVFVEWQSYKDKDNQPNKLAEENILFFAPRPTAGEKINEFQKDFGRPVIVGYGLSRPDDIVDSKWRTQFSRSPDYDLEDDTSLNKSSIYQHPDKVTEPRRRFRHSYDIYSLGLVLLEIGLWMDLQKIDIDRHKDVYDFRRSVLYWLVPDLWGQCGAIYAEVVRDCLTIDTHVSPAEEEQRTLALKLAQRLDKCVA